MLTALDSAAKNLLALKYPIFRTPNLLLFDDESHSQVHEDFSSSVDMSLLLPPPAMPMDTFISIWTDLGARLRGFHAWASEPAQSSLRAQVAKNKTMRQLKYNTTYNNFIEVLGNFPELLEGCKQTLEDVKDMAAVEYHKPATDENSKSWGIIHGDLWTGKQVIHSKVHLSCIISDTYAHSSVLVDKPESLWGEKPIVPVRIDWELAQVGHRCDDLGQMIGDLVEQHFLDGRDTLPAITSFLSGYGKQSDEMAFRTAIHAGVLFVHWYIRRPPGSGHLLNTRAKIVDAMRFGRDLILNGQSRDKSALQGTVLACLFEE